MATNNFDPNSLNQFFDKQFGQGSFNAGINQAQNAARLKTEAGLAKQQYQTKITALKKVKKMQDTYNQATAYWNDPNNKKSLQQQGVYKAAQDLKKDSMKKAELEAQGYDVNSYIDAMYNAASDGQFKTENDYNNYRNEMAQQAKINKQVSSDKKSNSSLTSSQSTVSKQNNAKQQSKTQSQAKPNNSSSNTQMNWYDKLNAGAMRVGDQFLRTVFGNNFADWNNQQDKAALQDKLKNNPNDTQAKKQLMQNQSAYSPAQTAGEKTLNYVGGTVGNVAPFLVGDGLLGTAEKGIAGLTKGTAQKVLTSAVNPSKLVNNPFGKSAIRGAMSGLAGTGVNMGAHNVMSNEKYTPSKLATNLALNGALGAAVPPALLGAGKGIQAAANKSMKSLLPTNEQVANLFAKNIKPDPLGLPAPQLKLNAPQMQLEAPNPVQPSLEALLNVGKKPGELQNPIPPIPNKLKNIMIKNDLQNSWLDFGQNTKNLPKARPQYITNLDLPADPLNRGQQYWQQRYEDFAKYVNDNGYTPNNLSHDAIQELWTHFAKNDEPVNIDQVAELAYPKGYEAPPKPKAEAPTQQKGPTLKDYLSSDPRIKEGIKALFPPTKPEPKVSRPATLDEMVQNLQSYLPPKQVVQEPLPLQFRVPKGFNPDLVPKILNRETPKLDANNPILNPDLLRTAAKPKNNIMQGLPPNPSKMGANGLKERGHIKTLKQSQNAVDDLKNRLNGVYEPTTNKEAVNLANNRINQDIEKAVSFVKNARVLKPEHVATAHRLIQEFQKSGQVERAVDIAEHIAAQGTKAGQAVQAYSIFDRLSPEGILVHANRVADRINSDLGPNQPKVTVTNNMANQLTDLATTVQKMTKQKTVANDVINIMDKAKSGGKLTTDETQTIRQFVDDAKQFIDDIKPKKTPPKAPNKFVSPKIKQEVVNFLDNQEQAARQRLASRKGRALSGLPVDDFYDYAVIGAAKLAKGTIKFADFSAQMVSEFGEEIRPYIQQIYDKASEMVNNEFKRSANRMSDVEKLTNKALQNGKLEPNDADNLRKFAASISKMSGNAKVEASQELQATLQALERPTLLEKISAAQTVSQLLNPKTQVRNAIGNELFYRLERITKLVATPIDWGMSKLSGQERTITFKTNNQGEYWKNWLTGAKAGWKGVNPEGLTTQYDLRPNVFTNKWNPLTYMQKALGASLKSFDYAGYKRGVNNTIGELATLRAMNEGLTGEARRVAIEKYIREVDENILAISDQYGKYITFQDNNLISVGLQKFKSGLNVGKQFGMGDLIIKYPRTPGALLARALEYSPAGFLKNIYQVAVPLYRGEQISTRQFIETFTRMLIGSAGISGIAYFLADKGVLTGTGNKDYDTADLETQTGKTKYSMNVTALRRWIMNGFNPNAADPQQGDQFISYNWAQPVATGMSIGANVAINKKTQGSVNFGQLATGAVGSILDTMVEQSVLQGVQKAFTSTPGQTVGDKVVDVLGDLPSSFVPTFFNQVRQISDNTTRNTYDPTKLQMFMNRAKNKIPGIASSLPPAFDTLGNQKQVYRNQSNNLFNVFLNPAFVNQYNPTPEAKMVLDVIKGTGDTSAAPRAAQKYLMINGVRYNLTPQQYSDYQQRLGTEVRMNLMKLLPYANSNDKEMLGKEIVKVLDKAGRTVREQLKQEYR